MLLLLIFLLLWSLILATLCLTDKDFWRIKIYLIRKEIRCGKDGTWCWTHVDLCNHVSNPDQWHQSGLIDFTPKCLACIDCDWCWYWFLYLRLWHQSRLIDFTPKCSACIDCDRCWYWFLYLRPPARVIVPTEITCINCFLTIALESFFCIKWLDSKS